MAKKKKAKLRALTEAEQIAVDEALEGAWTDASTYARCVVEVWLGQRNKLPALKPDPEVQRVTDEWLGSLLCYAEEQVLNGRQEYEDAQP